VQKWCSPATTGWFTEVIAGPIVGPAVVATPGWLVGADGVLGAVGPTALFDVGAKPAGAVDLTSVGSAGTGPVGAPASSGVRGEGTFVTGGGIGWGWPMVWVCGCG
jgi:hypothetical protein